MYLVRDGCLIFHGCVPVDRAGRVPHDEHRRPAPRRPRAVRRDRQGDPAGGRSAGTEKDLDLLWYLWGGDRSPLFGKDRITTLERDFIADKATHHETKNPYFELIHEPWFCDKILARVRRRPRRRGLIVNGHVPVKIEKGEYPVKRSGKAITIDGAFSEAYGDHGYTLVLEADRTLLAEHSHFESVEAAVRDGVDIIPKVSVVRTWDRPHRMADTERGDQIRCEIRLLERLIEAYRNNEIRQGGRRPWAVSSDRDPPARGVTMRHFPKRDPRIRRSTRRSPGDSPSRPGRSACSGSGWTTWPRSGRPTPRRSGPPSGRAGR